MKPEQKVWHNQLKPALDKLPGVEYERLELRTGSNGTPDVLVSCGRTVFIENKVLSGKSQVNLSGWRPGQKTWTKRHGAAGTKVFLFFGRPGEALLVDAVKLVDANPKNLSFQDPVILARWLGPVDERELNEFLRNH